MLNKGTIALFDWKAFILIVLIMILGLSTIFSATYTNTPVNATPLYIKQIGWIIIGIFFLLTGMSIDYQTIARYAYHIYAFSFILLLVVLVAGRSGFGAQRWIAIGGFSFQPSELAKIATAFAITRYFSDYPARHGYNVRELVIPGILIAIPVVLVLKQPDLGTGMVITFVSVVLIFLVRIRSRLLGILTLLILMTFPFLWHIFWENLKQYQKTRLLTFINPSADPTGTGYHIIQSKIAIGSGGFFGKGILQSTQSQLNFLPARHTDFIFSVFAEEWGFLGIFVLLILYLLLITWGLDVAIKAKDRLGMLMACSIISYFTFYCVINIGMTLGVFPVVGIPLPLMSYGGTSMITTLFSLGILFNIRKKRFLFY
ncbi:MAG: rod shape-determining protein RodA [Nitrospirae bacterium]|nr:rod shape-determining protein RodA [Nitrospirota bacterium]